MVELFYSPYRNSYLSACRNLTTCTLVRSSMEAPPTLALFQAICMRIRVTGLRSYFTLYASHYERVPTYDLVQALKPQTALRVAASSACRCFTFQVYLHFPLTDQLDRSLWNIPILHVNRTRLGGFRNSSPFYLHLQLHFLLQLQLHICLFQ